MKLGTDPQICPDGTLHPWVYRSGRYSCPRCRMELEKSQLKAATDRTREELEQQRADAEYGLAALGGKTE